MQRIRQLIRQIDWKDIARQQGVRDNLLSGDMVTDLTLYLSRNRQRASCSKQRPLHDLQSGGVCVGQSCLLGTRSVALVGATTLVD